ncbi:mechanosensitive ion channel family protein [Patescibacteria group bacterium]
MLDFLLNIQTAFAQVTTGSVTGETETQLSGLLEFFLIKIPSFIAAIIVFALFYLLSKAIKGIVESRLSQSLEENKEVQILAGRTAATTTVIIGATVALNIAGIDLTVIIAAAGFGVGFALKDIIINFFAGIMILAQKQFTIGDFINVEGTIGKIVEIQTRATILQALDGTKVVVPNSELFLKQVTSYTSNAFRRIEVVVGVEYDTNLNQAVETCYAAIKGTNGVLIEPKPAVLVDEFSDSSISLIVRAWVESRSGWLQIKSDLAVSIKTEFDKVGIGIPFPIRTIVYDKDAKAEKAAKPAWVAQEPKLEAVPVPAEPQVAPAAQAPVQGQAVPVAPAAPAVIPQAVTKPSKDQPGSAFLIGNPEDKKES